MKIYDTLDLTTPGLLVGNHGIWDSRRALKLPFQWGGRVTKYSRQEDGYPLDSIADEVAILEALAAAGMAPPIGDFVFFREVVSTYPGAWHSDPCGAYGYEMGDANRLPPGRFNIEAMRELPIEGSPGAWGDVAKPGNVVNGYLVDVRRTGSDLLRWTAGRAAMPRWEELAADLLARVHTLCQFPPGKRAEAYQDFWLADQFEHGQRRVVERAEQLGFAPKPGETVLDIGCQSGSFLQFAWRCTGGAGRFAGVEVNAGYIDCARALARSCGQNICIRQMDAVAERDAFLAWVRAYFPDGVTHLLACSMEKHLGERQLFDLIDEIGARRTYIETNAVAADEGDGAPPAAPMKLWPQVEARGGKHVGDSRDRNLRRLYRIER
jgi:hypothetical protein